jgi:hypothetical protein
MVMLIHIHTLCSMDTILNQCHFCLAVYHSTAAAWQRPRFSIAKFYCHDSEEFLPWIPKELMVPLESSLAHFGRKDPTFGY